MKKYFKFVGYVELVLWFIGLIAFIMYMAIGGSSHTIVTNGVKVTVPAFISEGYQWFMVIILFLFYIVIGPAIGLLFIHVANASNTTKVIYRNEDSFVNNGLIKPSTHVSSKPKETTEPSTNKKIEVKDDTNESDIEKQYKKAVELFNQREYKKAKHIFIDIRYYKDSNKYISQCDSLIIWHSM